MKAHARTLPKNRMHSEIMGEERGVDSPPSTDERTKISAGGETAGVRTWTCRMS